MYYIEVEGTGSMVAGSTSGHFLIRTCNLSKAISHITKDAADRYQALCQKRCSDMKFNIVRISK